jgi:hypothetical protein
MTPETLYQYLPDLKAALPLAGVAGLSLAIVALSFATMARAKAHVLRAGRQLTEAEHRWEVLVESCRQEFEARKEELDRQGADHALQTSPRPGINLSRRSQALRLHRKGDSPESIATALQIPRQEVDLLIKIHQIVLNNI